MNTTIIIALIGIFGMIIAIIIRPISGYRIDKIEAKAAIILNFTLIAILSFFFICLLSNFQFYWLASPWADISNAWSSDLTSVIFHAILILKKDIGVWYEWWLII